MRQRVPRRGNPEAPQVGFVPEGQTIIFEGPQRVGKTLAAVAWAHLAYMQGRRIHSNVWLGFPHERLHFRDVSLEGESRFRGAHVFIDELNFFFDGRRSLSAQNLRFAAFLLQQKKQGCNVTGTTHSLDSLDVRLRDNYDWVCRPRVHPAYPATPNLLRCDFEAGPLQTRPNHKPRKWGFVVRAGPFMGLYNTFETYDPFGDGED